jgi:hypothetical protein
MSLRPLLLAGMILGLPGAAVAQSNADKQVDVRPLIPPLRPFLPPNSLLTPGPAMSAPQSPYSSAPLFDPTRDQATPGLRLTIPSR